MPVLLVKSTGYCLLCVCEGGMCVEVHVCVHVCGGQWLMSSVFLITQSIFTLTVDRQGFSLDPKLMSLTWPVSVRDHPTSTSQC